MIKQETYNALRERYAYTSSWTIWVNPDDEKWNTKSNIGDTSCFADTEKVVNIINPEYIFVGLNPAKHNSEEGGPVEWGAFHSGDKKRSQDYKLRYALKDTKYWGSFITDIYTEIVETNSNAATKKATTQMTKQSLDNLYEIREMLGGTATIVAIGNKAHRILKKNLPAEIELKKIRHYASFINIDEYRNLVLDQLR